MSGNIKRRRFAVALTPEGPLNKIDTRNAACDPKNPLWRYLGPDVISASGIDDVAQEVFRRLARYDHQAELVENPQASLFEVLANVAAERSTISRNATSLAEGGSPGGERIASRLESEEEIARALLTLHPRQLELLKLQFLDGLTHVQIAQRIGITDQMVKGTLAESYLRLRQTLVPTQAT